MLLIVRQGTAFIETEIGNPTTLLELVGRLATNYPALRFSIRPAAQSDQVAA